MTVSSCAHVSTNDQDVALQLDALREASVVRVFDDWGLSEAGLSELNEAFAHLREGDTLVVRELDLLGRVLTQPLGTFSDLEARGVIENASLPD